jgi:hypothetical protein
MSVSDIWRAWPLKGTNPFLIKALPNNNQNEMIKKNKEVLSTIFKAQPVTTTNTDDVKDKVYIYKSKFNSTIMQTKDITIDTDQKPDDNVLLHFIKTDLKEDFLNICSNKSTTLRFYVIWKSCSSQGDEASTCKYGVMSVNVIDERSLHEPQLTSNKQPLRLCYRELSLNPIEAQAKSSLDPKDIIMINLTTKSNHIKHDFSKSDVCVVQVLINLSNLSLHHSFEMVLTAKNSSHHFDKKYLWLGCTQKYVKLKAKDSRQVKFKLGFLTNGFYEIGQVSNDNILKMNLFEATNSLTSFDNLIGNQTKTTTTTTTNTNVDKDGVNNSLQNLMESTAISVYLKNKTSKRFEFFKCLNSFTVSVCK